MVAAMVLFTGCTGGGGPNVASSPSQTTDSSTPDQPTLPFETPGPGECTQSFEPPQPSPKGDLKPEPYPAYPGTVTAESAEGFVVNYHYALVYNEILTHSTENTTISIGATTLSRLTEPAGDGYLVGIQHSGYTEEEDGLHADYYGRAVYYITPEYALSLNLDHDGPLDEVESLQSVNYSSSGTLTIYCQSDE
ncbi:MULTISPECIES: hypothetical protein [Haloferax]|uniref:Uncharacterized protein n=1 Tax=Haloferax marinum TaxID=2666143 RepID=A0A6A8G2N6_9EURY|nr:MULTISPECIES: hypothetical protein [Haloferax]KAB1196038.1 hypothetical protein Hfx1150_00315 [Haloferax sp. CBA1150]MRW95017.1 hypothetical protein [Haloferax marinum]